MNGLNAVAKKMDVAINVEWNFKISCTTGRMTDSDYEYDFRDMHLAVDPGKDDDT